MMTYTLEIRPGSPGFVFAIREDGAQFDVYLQNGAEEPRIADPIERAALIAACRAYKAPVAPVVARDTSRDRPNVDAEMRRAGFDMSEYGYDA